MMSRSGFSRNTGVPGNISKLTTRLFDLLLIGGYAACLFFTYTLFADRAHNRSAVPPPQNPTPIVEVEASPTPVPGNLTRPTPTPVPVSADLIEAMEIYVGLINAQEYEKAIKMRGDDNVPSVDRMKQTKAIKLVSAVPYPRVNREQGSIYVLLEIEKNNDNISWSGRIDWEKRGTQWVTIKWDSAADPPVAEPELQYPPDKPNPDMAPAEEEKKGMVFDFNTQ